MQHDIYFISYSTLLFLHRHSIYDLRAPAQTLLRIEVRLEKIQDENDDDDVTLAGDVYANYEYWYDFRTT